MAMDWQQELESCSLTAGEIAERTAHIYDTVLDRSRWIRQGNFTRIHPADIELLFDLYDAGFFGGTCRRLLGEAPLHFRLSRRMTSAAGKATVRRRQDGWNGRGEREYEIAVSTTLLFQTFQDGDRSVVMSGLVCRDRLQALQRILEHEMIHLIEYLVWDHSSCSAPRFRSIANRYFGHTEHRHQLITPREQAMTRFGIVPGSRVSFRMDGRHYEGVVNRITRRATVLVEDEHGQRYTDGKRYAKFYVPVSLLKPADAE